ncbi:orotidine-5'-phosphate decarboxylase [Candidatus Woesearchaeota archaeon CG11_big_fil_rev_8_21_14_0_20_43_8]|nr:MAG: orotidine-5'-phosphate decarboxylase [Candidatus Woesearchaeota archaeon CG11_big_fil_rev_8_21_14_0_20_43_8]PIO05290.1 MAG: orotidine-5'-phosphate decarboxylase [Candidatus Woesearchaeota archaeon CG08_land_8_20_14_0_20_43_7]
MRYSERAETTDNPIAKKLFSLMEMKKTNLCLSLDVTEKKKFLLIISKVANKICVLKTHMDIVEDFDMDFAKHLQKLSKQHEFLIFEDRKFADIGNTVKQQYTSGVHRIVEWSHITNAHTVAGYGIIEGLRSAASGRERGLLLLAQMSAKENLITEGYTKKTVELAKNYNDFVIGFIGNGSDDKQLASLVSISEPGFVIMTPGIKLASSGDGLGQSYATPQSAITAGSDVIIVGRGIYGADDPASEADKYRRLAWDAYEKRVKQI